MLKVALLAAAVALSTTAATATNAAADPVAMPVTPTDLPCHPDPALELACALHAVAPDGPGAPADLGSLAAPPSAPAAAWSPLQPTGDLAFKDAATEPGSVLLAGVDCRHPQRLLPALLAIAAMVVLLRRRPT